MRALEPLALAPLRNEPNSVDQSNDQKRLDRVAIWLSGLCLVHCLAVPMALLLTPSLSAWLDATETQTHWLLFGLALPISGVALYRGYKREPRAMTLAMGLIGLLLMLVGVVHLFGEDLEITFTTLGVILVMLAHIRNLHAGHNHDIKEATP
jgi:cation transport ATPase